MSFYATCHRPNLPSKEEFARKCYRGPSHLLAYLHFLLVLVEIQLIIGFRIGFLHLIVSDHLSYHFKLHFHPQQGVFPSKSWLWLDSPESPTQVYHQRGQRRLETRKRAFWTTKHQELLVILSVLCDFRANFCQNHLWWGHIWRHESLVSY